MVTDDELAKLRDLYLADLGKEVVYGESVRPRVRKVNAVWSKIESIYQDDEPLDLDEFDNVWVWSDTHFGHKNVIKYSDRPYETIEEMESVLVARHNVVVGHFDLVIWVGDVAFLNADKTNEILAELRGNRILVIGNHDMIRGKPRYKKLDFDEAHLLYAIDDLFAPLLFTHYPMENIPYPWVNIHGHVHNKPYAMENSLQHINVSVEAIDYKPINLNELQKMARTRIQSMEQTNAI